MKSKVVVLPIDDRPCHNRHVFDAMKYMNDYDLVYPNSKILGHFTISGNTQACSNFIEQESSDAEVLIVSIDSLLFGGLVQARSADSESIDTYEERLNVLKRIKLENPKLLIYVYSVIMRLTTTVTNSNNLDIWESIFKYSQLVHRAKIDSKFSEDVEVVKGTIPQKDLEAYLNARKRNHCINKSVVTLTHEGIIDYSVLVQEDTSEYGMHIEEQNILKNLIQGGKRPETCVIKNGTDEMVALLLARYINKNNPVCIALDTTFVDRNFQAKYEDRPVLENLNKSMQIACMHEGDSEILALILPTQGKSIDYCFENHELLETQKFLSHVERLTYDKIGILDIKNANGGDVALLEDVVDKVHYDRIVAYSAWNTASNAIGSFLLDLTIASYNKINRNYLNLRILDDAYYQGSIRLSFNKWMQEEGFDVWAMNESKLLDETLTQVINGKIKDISFFERELKVKAVLPWGRSFEIELEED